MPNKKGVLFAINQCLSMDTPSQVNKDGTVLNVKPQPSEQGLISQKPNGKDYSPIGFYPVPH